MVSKVIGLTLLSKVDNAGVNESAGSRGRVLSAVVRRVDPVVAGYFLIFLSARLHAPGKWALKDLLASGGLLGRYYCVLVASIALANKDEDKGVVN